MRATLLLVLLVVSSLCFAGTITVSSPNAGDYLGKSNTVKFNIVNASHQVRVTVTATRVANSADQITTFQDYDPDADGKISGSLSLNFASSAPEGLYKITVTAVESGATYNTITPFNVTVDVNAPRFKDTNPLTGSFVRGTVPITVDLEEPNIKEWRVQINSADIPSNSGSTTSFTVNWDTSTIRNDGSQTITVTATDLAKNSSSKTINVTLDRVAPTSNILTPTSSTVIRPDSNVSVAVNVVDQFSGSVDQTGIDVYLQKSDGTFVGRVARKSISSSGSTVSWTGRIRYNRSLPTDLQLVVTAVDKAGNQATKQIVKLKISS